MRLLTFLLLITIACKGNHTKINGDLLNRATASVFKEEQPSFFDGVLKKEESFIDSMYIGKKTLNKIEIVKSNDLAGPTVTVKFYSKRQANKWTLVQKFKYSVETAVSPDPKIADFNNDGLNDFTYVFHMPVMKGNELRMLYIYDKSKDQLVLIKNSMAFPNLLYNKELNCVDAFFIGKGCSTLFLKINGDIFKEFAEVKLDNHLTVYEYDRNGHKKILRQDPFNEPRIIRFKNYRPLKRYDDK